MLGRKINEFFDLVRPIIEFKFETVLARANNIFEVMTVDAIDVLLKVGFKLCYFLIGLNVLRFYLQMACNNILPPTRKKSRISV